MTEPATPQEISTEIHRHIVESYLESILAELQSIQIILDLDTTDPGQDIQAEPSPGRLTGDTL